jgi:tight adherence protein B
MKWTWPGQRKRQWLAVEKRLPEMLSRLARHLRSGQGLSMAFQSLALDLEDPLGHELKQCLLSHQQGRPLPQALQNFIARFPLPDLELLGIALEIQHETGGNLAQLMEVLASMVKARQLMRAELRSYTAEARLSALILTSLPLLVVVALVAFRGNELNHFAHHPLGAQLLGAATLALVAGLAIVRARLHALDAAL